MDNLGPELVKNQTTCPPGREDKCLKCFYVIFCVIPSVLPRANGPGRESALDV